MLPPMAAASNEPLLKIALLKAKPTHPQKQGPVFGSGYHLSQSYAKRRGFGNRCFGVYWEGLNLRTNMLSLPSRTGSTGFFQMFNLV